MSIAPMRTAIVVVNLVFPCLALANDASPSSGAFTVNVSSDCADGAVDAKTIRQLITRETSRQGVDARLALAIADQESGFGAHVNSTAGARGPMQLMPRTAARYQVTDICDAAENIRGGVSYLKDLTAAFGGNIMLVVAAYNAGEGRVVAAGGVPDIAETVSYTALVTNAYYGFDNYLKGGKRAAKAAAAGSRAVAAAGVDLLAQTPASEQPTPIHQTRPQAGDHDWIGGSVLYVQ
ncbi:MULTISPECIES: lytic transglycosylase domain-containing protein [Rhizobium]|uniref:Lytic transglycosylase domain-containing protein n=1 Tax=Rhizobium tumorigenes TaxID=2041385 RepID=A0AAF1KSX8_9HYPH|nr:MULTISPECIES: lytic transglycosylase domain-containing protein [Rhizobium]MBO9101978.1 lytic transglycosylase domain-containing protein [Rhizobium sp. L58/93]MBO9172171.1 lytic transglycosylase domain-containing protein [Rhizobium sp. L245/93]MBO9187911.1 lytic transglycosylase domain-containing protein [Rhizobium sp. E27B/91]QXZ87544.1 lytic transglycosylase domain-containing protein [Rhizobium sp. K1/93]QXZ93584.1 lytic transglycosylase domain-containing protein [Rhizobium sp. K15/93]